MTKEKAIEILNGQIVKLKKITGNDCNIWKTQTASYIKLFFDENSPEFSFITKYTFYFSDRSGTYDPRDQIQPLTTFIEDCIETITNRGLYKPPKKNFLYTVDNRWLAAIVVAGLTGMYFLGHSIGKTEADIQNIELRQEVKELKKSATTVSPTFVIPDNKANNDTNSNDTSNRKK